MTEPYFVSRQKKYNKKMEEKKIEIKNRIEEMKKEIEEFKQSQKSFKFKVYLFKLALDPKNKFSKEEYKEINYLIESDSRMIPHYQEKITKIESTLYVFESMLSELEKNLK